MWMPGRRGLGRVEVRCRIGEDRDATQGVAPPRHRTGGRCVSAHDTGPVEPATGTPVQHMDRSLWAVLAGTFSLRFSTGLTGAMLGVYLAHLHRARRPGRRARSSSGVFSALFYLAELVLSPVFGILSDRQGHHRVMLYGPIFGAVAVIMTGFTADLGLPAPLALLLAPITGSLVVLGSRALLEGASTAASIPSILGYIAMATAGDERLRGKASARFEGATLLGLGAGFAVAPVAFAVLGPDGVLPERGPVRGSRSSSSGRSRTPAVRPPPPGPPHVGFGRYLELLRQLARLAAGTDLDRGQRVDRAVVQPVDLPVREGEPGLPGPGADARLQRGPDLAARPSSSGSSSDWACCTGATASRTSGGRRSSCTGSSAAAALVAAGLVVNHGLGLPLAVLLAAAAWRPSACSSWPGRRRRRSACWPTSRSASPTTAARSWACTRCSSRSARSSAR